MLHIGYYPEGYVEGLGFASSHTVSVKSPVPNYPNHKAYGIERGTNFTKHIQIPTIKPLFAPESKPSEKVHKELTELVEKITKENITMPGFTTEAKVMVEKLKEEIKKKKVKNYGEIAKLEAKRNDTQDTVKIQKLEKQIKEWQDKNRELEEVEEEIKVLAVSNQTYSVVSNAKIGTDPNIDYKGNTYYDLNTGQVELQFAAGTKSIPLDVFAHELKHAYQFETGTISMNSTLSKYGLYDKQYEREAFIRGQRFGSRETFRNQASVYGHVPDSHDFSSDIMRKGIGDHNWKSNAGERSVFVITPEYIRQFADILQDKHATPEAKANAEAALQKLSDDNGTVFRANGKTYIPTIIR
jgi:hypothetical protein